MINEALKELMRLVFYMEIGYVSEIDVNNETCKVIVSHGEIYTCDIPFMNAYGTLQNDKKIWGDLSILDEGTMVLLLRRGKKAIISGILTGYNNKDDIYSEKGQVKINRTTIPTTDRLDLDDEDRLVVGEKLIRSKAFTDLFWDYFGNLVLDSSKEFIIRIGDRDSDNKISSPETTLRIGRVRDDTGNEKIDSGAKKIKMELVFNDKNKLTLNEDGQWEIETENPSGDNAKLTIQNDGKIVINGGNIEIARNGDDVGIDSVFKTWLNTHTHSGASPPNSPYTGSDVGQIAEGNPNLLSD